MTRARSVLGAIAVTALVLGAFTVAAGPASAAKAKAKPTVTVVKVTGLGKILGDSKGMTLYTLTGSDGAAVPCTEGCLAAWPPLVSTGKPKGAKGVTGLSVTDSGQVTHGGLPLYLFAADTAKGQATGEGISSFGGTWHVVKAGASSSGASSGSSNSGSSNSGSNSGSPQGSVGYSY
jgi:predicted lipoprotein with Yx(FWY)xxD motif